MYDQASLDGCSSSCPVSCGVVQLRCKKYCFKCHLSWQVYILNVHYTISNSPIIKFYWSTTNKFLDHESLSSKLWYTWRIISFEFSSYLSRVWWCRCPSIVFLRRYYCPVTSPSPSNVSTLKKHLESQRVLELLKIYIWMSFCRSYK